MMTAWRLACQAARLPGMICALMDEAVYFCFGNCVAAQRPANKQQLHLRDGQQQPPRMTGELRCNGLAKSGRYSRPRLAMMYGVRD